MIDKKTKSPLYLLGSQNRKEFFNQTGEKKWKRGWGIEAEGLIAKTIPTTIQMFGVWTVSYLREHSSIPKSVEIAQTLQD